MTARPGRTPAAAMEFTSAATSRRISCAILMPSRILAGICSLRGDSITPRLGHKNVDRGDTGNDRGGEYLHSCPSGLCKFAVRSVSYNAVCHDSQRLAGNSGLPEVQTAA